MATKTAISNNSGTDAPRQSDTKQENLIGQETTPLALPTQAQARHSLAQSIIEGKRNEVVSNNAWQRARKATDLPDLHIHELRHTVGMRLREAGAREETIVDVLWHTRRCMTAHYSVAQVGELPDAEERISAEQSREKPSQEMEGTSWKAEFPFSPHRKQKSQSEDWLDCLS